MSGRFSDAAELPSVLVASLLTTSGVLQVRPPSSEYVKKMSVLSSGFLDAVHFHVEVTNKRGIDSSLVRTERP